MDVRAPRAEKPDQPACGAATNICPCPTHITTAPPLPPSQPNYRLLVDRPFRDKARSHIAVLAIWAVMVAMAALNLYSRVGAPPAQGAAARQPAGRPALPACQLAPVCAKCRPGPGPTRLAACRRSLSTTVAHGASLTLGAAWRWTR
jgi:hypothetical protein